MPDAERWRLVDSVLAQALELPEGAPRRAFLDRRCGTDPELREQVERLIAADREAAGFLEEPPYERLEEALAAAGAGDRDGGSATGEPARPELEPGTTVGRYVVAEKLGEGGMGTVYAARDPELERTVALKLVHPDRSAGQSRDRLLREAQALARVSHPNVVAVYDVGRHGEAVFLAMEHVRGGTLEDWLGSEERSRREILTAFLAAARGLAAAHAAGIVHRDFKPSNVLRDDDGGLKVADFGLARAAVATETAEGAGGDDEAAHGPEPDAACGEPPDRLATPLTGAGWRLGTPGYMAPEQHTGGAVGPASDQFAFCVALHRALCGEHPFAAATRAEARARVLAGEVAPPPKGSRVPRRLRSALLRGMAVRGEERWPSMGELVRILEREAGRRSRPLPAAAALLALLLVALLLWTAEERRDPGAGAPAAHPASVAVLPFDAPGGDPEDAYLAEGMTDELISSLVRVEPLRVPARRSVYALHDRGLTSDEIAGQLDVAHLLEGTVRRQGNRLRVTARMVDAGEGRQLWSETYEGGLSDIFDLQEDIARAIAARLEVELAGDEPLVERPTDDLHAYSLYLKGRSHWNQRTPEGLRAAIGFFERAIEEDPDFAQAYSGLADVYAWMPTYVPDPDPDALSKARSAARRALELAPRSAEAHASMGNVLAIAGVREEAETHLRRAIELEPTSATAHHWYGALLVRESHRPSAGVAELETARRLDPASTPILAMLAEAYHRAGRHGRALETERELQVLDPDWPSRIARTYIALGRWDEAVAAVEALGPPSARPVILRGYLAEAQHLRGDYEGELATARRALADHPGHFLFLGAEGAALAGLGRSGEVRIWFGRVVDRMPPGGPSVFALLTTVAELRVHGERGLARELAGELTGRLRQHGTAQNGGFQAAWVLATALLEAGRPAEGAEVLSRWFAAAGPDEQARSRTPDYVLDGVEGWMAALAGRRETARSRADALRAREADSEVLPYAAMIYAALGDRTTAVEALRERIAAGMVFNRNTHAHIGLEPLRAEDGLSWKSGSAP